MLLSFQLLTLQPSGTSIFSFFSSLEKIGLGSLFSLSGAGLVTPTRGSEALAESTFIMIISGVVEI